MDKMETLGKSLQVPFTWKGCNLWMGADYYQEESGDYLVSFKAGFQHGWFALSMDYGVCLDMYRISASADILTAKTLEPQRFQGFLFSFCRKSAANCVFSLFLCFKTYSTMPV